jgi:hemolysin III
LRPRLGAVSATSDRTLPVPLPRPRLRGVLHQWACVVSVVLGVVLVIVAPGGTATFAAAAYALSVTGLFATSAVYHRITWRSPVTRRWVRRLDHSMIFVLIAGTYTPFALLALEGPLATWILVIVWAGAAGGIALQFPMVEVSPAVGAIPYVMLGWVAVAATPQLLDHVGLVPTLIVALGGVLYTVGAVVYARKRPDPAPGVFGYHEVFHALVIAAAALHYAVVAFWVLPD